MCEAGAVERPATSAFVTLAVLLACSTEPSPASSSYERLNEAALAQQRILCECMVKDGEFPTIPACVDHFLHVPTDEELACVNEILSLEPPADAAIECQADAQANYAGCLAAQPCPATGAFDCDDGSQVPASFECDGFDDCPDGEDEPDGCPPGCFGPLVDALDACDSVDPEVETEIETNCFPPFQCDDGLEVPFANACDGTEDCDDGEDEADC